MIFGKRKKFINIPFKLSLWVWIATKGHIMMIALIIYLSFVGIAIAGPGAVEVPSPIPRNEGSKFLDGNLKLRENSTQSWLNITRICFGPFRRQWIEARESLKNCGAKFSRSRTTGVQLPYVKQTPNTDQSGGNSADDGNIILGWQWRILPFVGLIPIIMFLIDSLYRMAHHSTDDVEEP